jgi:hypothetical protein
MKKYLRSLMAALMVSLMITAPAFATCYNGSCDDPDPNPCGTVDCLGGNIVGGNFMVKMNGYSEAFGKNTDVYNGGMFDYRAKVGDAENGLKANAIGSFYGEDSGEGHRITGGRTFGTGTWKTRTWEGVLNN